MMNLPALSRQLPIRGFPLLITLLLLPPFLHSQQQYNRWFFGRNAGLDFSSGSPIPLYGGAMTTEEGGASFSDPATGQLLLYTNGLVV
ncbi:MAG: hypothetical protein DYG96_06395, partial [Chlorobi bacterium CHB2]|nr:hypothetical protein [Chlorobi bacterium CHB2]